MKPNYLRSELSKAEAEAVLAYINKEMNMPGPCSLDSDVSEPTMQWFPEEMRYKPDSQRVHTILFHPHTMEYSGTVQKVRLAVTDFLAGYRAGMAAAMKRKK